MEHATIAGLARRLAVSWWTLWRAVKPQLEALAADESRFDRPVDAPTSAGRSGTLD